MATLLSLLVVLIVATGVIAYLSDNLGKKLGKKRISIFGLRPRQTATIITIGSSELIMMFAVAALLIAYRPLREALTRYDQAKAENEQFRVDNQKLATQSIALQGSVDTSRRQLQAERKQVAATQRQVATGRRQLAGLQGKLALADAQLTTAVRGESQALRRANDARSRLSQMQASLAITDATLKATTANLGQAQQQLSLSQDRLTLVKNQARDGLKEIRANYLEEAKEQKDIADLQRKLTDLEGRRNALESLVADAEQRLALAGRVVTGEKAVSVGQVLDTVEMPAHTATMQARTRLTDLMSGAVAPLAAQGFNSVKLVPLPLTVDNQVIELNQDQLLDRLAGLIQASNTPTSVRVIAARDHAQGETMLEARMVLIPVRRVLESGQVIAEASVDGTQSDALIFRHLVELTDSGEQTARQLGVVPPLTLNVPNFYAPNTNERLFDALRRIQSVHGPTTVRLEADQDISTIDRVAVRFVVEGT